MTLRAKLALKFKQRAETLKMEGKDRDRRTLEYFIGATEALSAAGLQSEANRMAVFCHSGVSLLGYRALDKILKKDGYPVPTTGENAQQDRQRKSESGALDENSKRN